MSTSDKRVAATYQYDPLDRLTDAQGARRFYNNTRLATVIEGERSTCFFEHDTQPLALQRSGTAADTTLLATDAQTSVLTSLPATASPSVHHYTPYGHQAAASGLSGVPGFNGEHPDPLTGHYLLGQGYRAFNPVLMRFNSPDSLSPFEEGGINAYAYCEGDPINQTDPSGHTPLFLKGILRALNLMKKSNKVPASNNTVSSTLSNVSADATTAGPSKTAYTPEALTDVTKPFDPPPYIVGYDMSDSIPSTRNISPPPYASRPPRYEFKGGITLFAPPDISNLPPAYPGIKRRAERPLPPLMDPEPRLPPQVVARNRSAVPILTRQIREGTLVVGRRR